ncbi:MAG: hypothetical protein HC882_08030 [Acidobacteria bacterium]|nr:hypothetical protein [Acidobacteriota bacterium]
MIKDGSVYCDACGFLCLEMTATELIAHRGTRAVRTRERMVQIALHDRIIEVRVNPRVCDREACVVAIESNPAWQKVRRPREQVGHAQDPATLRGPFR